MSFVRTILGDIRPSNLGVCYSHEHVVINRSYATERNPDFLLNDSEKIAAELVKFRDAGGNAMIDTMPGGGAGRDVQLLAEISRRTGVHIVCPTGVHLAKYYPPAHWSTRISDDEFLETFVGEIEQGIDLNDLAGPAIQRSSHRAGLIKIATGGQGLTDQSRKIFRAAARAQAVTGCPILTHTEQGAGALEQIQILSENGADLSHVVLSHLDRKPDPVYQRQILKRGVNIEYDSAFRWKPGQANATLELLTHLLPDFPGQLLLGMDAARSTYWSSYGGAPGLTFLLTEFVPSLRGAGISQDLVERIFIHNPARTYQFFQPRGTR